MRAAVSTTRDVRAPHPEHHLTPLAPLGPRRVARPRGCVVAVEQGARFDPALLGDDEPEETVVLTQGTLEGSAEFAERVCRRTARVERQGHTVSDVALVVAADADGRRLEARYFLTRALVALLAHEPRAEISLVTPAPPGAGLPADVLALFELLLADLPANVSLRLRLLPVQASEHPSGIYLKAPLQPAQEAS